MAIRYHTIFSKIWIDPEFKKLSAESKLLLLALRTAPENNAASIFVIYPETMSRYISKSVQVVKKCIKELKHFVSYENDIIWIRNGLKFNKHLSMDNEKQKKSIVSILDDLPKVAIVQKFCEYYGFDGYGIPIPMSSEGVSNGYSIHDTDYDTDTDSDNNNNSEKEKDIIPYSEIIQDLNNKARTSYKPTSKITMDLIKARFNEGFRLDDFMKVHSKKCEDWLGDEKMSVYLRPATLYSNKFEAYLNQPDKKEVQKIAKETPAAREHRLELQEKKELARKRLERKKNIVDDHFDLDF